MEKIKNWWRGFVKKQRLAMLDSDDDTERWHIYISGGRILIGLISLILVLALAVVLLVVYTPVMDTLGGYPGNRSREILIQNVMKLDSLERQMANLTLYSDNIALIMEGKTPVIRDVSRIGDSVQMQDKTLVAPSLADSMLRARMEAASGDYSLAASVASPRSGAMATDLIAPAKGLVQTRFSPVNGRFGVEIVTTSNHPIVAVRDGSVILNVWSPEQGYVVEIQHSDNMLSVYRQLSSVERAVGARVKAGEIIGVASPLGFELWYNGTPVDPENYIVF